MRQVGEHHTVSYSGRSRQQLGTRSVDQVYTFVVRAEAQGTSVKMRDICARFGWTDFRVREVLLVLEKEEAIRQVEDGKWIKFRGRKDKRK